MEIDAGNKKVAVVGLGYVGLPVAVAFAKRSRVIGFDINTKRVSELKKGSDLTGEVDSEELKNPDLLITHDENDLENCNFFIITVPTPIDLANKPDFSALRKSSETVGKALAKGDIVVYESTVYPGLTEELCIPILERVSGLKLGEFHVGYSPERINPGDKEHTFTKIAKVVSGSSSEALDAISRQYGSVIDAPIFKASSIKVAEAAKVIENTQRDLNIALMNELSLIFDRLEIDTLEVLEAAATKWNFLPFKPGLVGGHCIGVDPYYLTYQAEKNGYLPQVILAGRKINDNMGSFVVSKLVKKIIQRKMELSKVKVCVLGVTFKENCPDVRNSKVLNIIKELKEYDIDLTLVDPCASSHEVSSLSGQEVKRSFEGLAAYDAALFCVGHREFVQMSERELSSLVKPDGVIFDLKGIFPKAYAGFEMWRL